MESFDEAVEEGRGGGGGRFNKAAIGFSAPLIFFRSGVFGVVDLIFEGGGGTRLIGGTGRVAMGLCLMMVTSNF